MSFKMIPASKELSYEIGILMFRSYLNLNDEYLEVDTYDINGNCKNIINNLKDMNGIKIIFNRDHLKEGFKAECNNYSEDLNEEKIEELFNEAEQEYIYY